MRFAFIAKHRSIWPVAWLCEALNVSRSGFHAWLNRSPSQRSRDDEALCARMRASFLGSDRTYGARRVWRDILAEGFICGLHRIERLMTDNAWAYRYSLRDVCASLGARQKFIKPHCPWQNGKVERLNRTLATEWAYRQVFTSNTERAAALAPWIEHYNTRRRHSALGGLPPISRLAPT